MGKDDKNDKIKDLFIEASKKALEGTINKPVVINNKPDQELIDKAIEITKEGKTQWDLLASDMEGKFAERIRNEMDSLSGREFIRNYLKLAEYFKPKMTRQEEAIKEDDDNTLIIEVRHSSHNYEDGTIIDITEDSNEDNACDKPEV